jgi:hypothetical protein
MCKKYLKNAAINAETTIKEIQQKEIKKEIPCIESL